MLEIFIACAFLGLFAGISAGLFGIGGGVVLVPFLSWLFELKQFPSEQIMLLAVATSLASALFTSTASVRTHFLLGNIHWNRVMQLSPGLLLGAVGGAILADYVSSFWLRRIFISYLLYTGLAMALPKTATGLTPKAGTILDYPMGLLIGVLSAILGIGGGTMTVPYLSTNGLKMKNAVATSSACTLPIAVAAAASYMYLGWNQPRLPEGSLGYVYLPAFTGIILTSLFSAQIGAKLANQLSSQRLKRYFAGVLFLMALKMAG